MTRDEDYLERLLSFGQLSMRLYDTRLMKWAGMVSFRHRKDWRISFKRNQAMNNEFKETNALSPIEWLEENNWIMIREKNLSAFSFQAFCSLKLHVCIANGEISRSPLWILRLYLKVFIHKKFIIYQWDLYGHWVTLDCSQSSKAPGFNRGFESELEEESRLQERSSLVCLSR